MSKGKKMGHTDDMGYDYTDEDLDVMAEKIGSEDFSDFIGISEPVYGATKPVDVSKSVISFQISNPIKERIFLYAQKNNCSVSDYIRSVVYEDISKQTV